MRAKILIGALILFLLGAGWFTYQQQGSKLSLRINPDTNISVPVPNNWIRYDGGSWSISYPPSWSISKHGQLNFFSFKDSNGNSVGGVDFGPLDAHPEAAELKQFVALHPGTDFLDAMLAFLNGFYINTKVIASRKVYVGSTTAAQFIYLDPAIGSHQEYTNQVTFIDKNGYQVDFTRSLPNTSNPDPSTLNEYYAILSSFRTH